MSSPNQSMPVGAMTLRERAETLVARIALGLPHRVQRALAGAGPVRVDGEELHAEAQLMLALLAASRRTPAEDLPLPQARAQLTRVARSVAGPLVPMSLVEDRVIPGPAGPIPVRRYVPRGYRGAGGLLVYLHGGGCVLGSLDSADAPCRLLASRASVQILSVDYRLAPEHRFPAAVDDALAAYRWAAGCATSLGADPRRVGVGGDSAGGCLAAVVSLLAKGDPIPPALQLLIYPVTDLANEAPSRALFADGYYLTAHQIAWFSGQYLASPADALDLRASPLLAPDDALRGAAPAVVVTAGFDPLRDEAEAYARRLRHLGVPTTLRREGGLLHGFANVLGVGRAGRDAVESIARDLASGLS